MVKSRLLGFVAVLLLFCSIHAGRAAEAWSDATCPPVAGLELWLDAQRLAAARQAEGSDPVRSGERLASWYDASGHGRHAVQADPARQPQLVHVPSGQASSETEGDWVVRFDGQDDYLRVLKLDRRYTSVTLFVVTAPHSNAGHYRGIVAAHQRGRRDYETGFNLDLNAPFSTSLHNLNFEGRGFGGARDLMRARSPFGTLHVIEAVADAARQQVTLVIDGKPGGQREYSAAELIADQFTIGARHLENGPAAPPAQSFLHGDIVEVLLFRRALADDERRSIRTYLQQKYAALQASLPETIERPPVAENAEPLVPVADPPLVQMLLGGFSVRELPVELTNINNLRYRTDGKLYALGYNGDIWLLSDADGDGLEETSHRFFENQGRLRGPIGMAVIPAGHALLADAAPTGQGHAQGVVVASKGKISAILDLDGDDQADRERVIATGWKEIPQNVDAVGVAIHPEDGAIYFGLGTAAYNNAYLLDEQGRSAFDLGSERGTIQRIAPDLRSRETVCTGVRFTIGMAFDRHHQLFVTDQEGATWLPNGNPFDELLHIQPGHHYGFPPRHPRHLPQVFDQPSLFDYKPQHQSTCGMAFNVPAEPDGPIFGPASWRGDLLVCGQSRGKLYRTRLWRDSDGRYLAENQLIACLGMLTVDCCVSPRGDLLVACHSGGPDWGTGPTGQGKLFRIRYEGQQLPQPVTVWSAGPQEVRVQFDRPLDPAHLKALVKRTKITYGPYVAAGDRFESLRPGYAVTELQQATPRFRLAVHAASITADLRTLILSTAPHQAAVAHALTLPGMGREEVVAQRGELVQHAEIDLAYAPHGVWATWQPDGEDQPAWRGWLPHLDLEIARQMTQGMPEQEALWSRVQHPGTLQLETRLDIRGLFLPAVQPNSQLDYDPQVWHATAKYGLQFRSPDAFTLAMSVDGKNLDPFTPADSDPAQGRRKLVWLSLSEQPVAEVVIRLPTGENATPALRPSWIVGRGEDKDLSGALALDRFLLPGIDLEPAETAPAAVQSIPELADADWQRGEQVFHSEQAGCAKCHVAHGKGGQIGPDLSNLVHRDYASVLRDITQPSFAINPDYITYHVLLNDGRVLNGTVRTDGNRLLIGDQEGKVTEVDASEIDELRPSRQSVMPQGITEKLNPQRLRDLMAFLLQAPPHD